MMVYARPLVSLAAPTAATLFTLGEPHAGFDAAKKLKDRISGRYDEAISLSMPGRDGLTSGPDQSEIYDDTAVIAAPEFASRIQQGVIPNFSRWTSFIAGLLVDDPQEKHDLTVQLDQVNEYLFEMINSSNFPVEVTESILDLALGTGAIRIDASPGANPFTTRSVPLRGLSFGIGPDGQPDPIFETRKIQARHLKVFYPRAEVPEEVRVMDPLTELEVTEAWERDWSDPAVMRYRASVYLAQCNNAVIFEEDHTGDGSCAYIVFRWTKASGEGWGRGPLFNLLPSLRKVNFAERALLDHTDIALAGIWTIEDDGVINVDTVKLAPGALVPKAPGSQGLQNVTPGVNFDLSQFVLEEARANIRKALYTEQLGNPNKTPMSATEVSQRMAELARAIGSPFGRVLLEMVFPSVLRFLYLLKKRKLITMPAVDGKEIKIISTSPLAQAQRFEEIEAIDRFLGILAGRFGPEMVNIVVDSGETGLELADKFQVPAKILRPPAKQKEIMGQLATMAQARTQGAAAGPVEPGEPTGAEPTGP